MVALVAVLAICLAGLTAISMQVRCIDAAREAARLAARGDATWATLAAQNIAPPGAVIDVRRDGDFVLARVTARSALLPMVAIGAESVSAAEESAG
ncbi:TadE family type IV pilus minor pilin [Mycobacterium sp. pW049]|uniref:TadE family type IV pilus minor pilin n=1 Tax=[Mycobacterium] bulgaricum TaxID=3238985 RepID=UPI00351B055B